MLTETFPPVLGGAETHARTLANRLNGLGMPTFVITQHCDPESSVTDTIDGTPTLRLPPSGMSRWGKFIMAPHAYRELLARRDEYDVVYVCGLRVLSVPAILAARKLNKACVLRSETNGEMNGAYAASCRKLPIGEKVILLPAVISRNAILRQADGYIGITSLVTDEFRKCGMNADRVHEIPNGIDTEVFHPVDAREKARLRKKLWLPLEKTLAINTCRLVKGKGVEYLLQAWAEVASAWPDASLVIVGSGAGEAISCEDDLRQFVREKRLQKRVIFTGWTANVAEYLQACDMFVFPTEYEGFGLSLVEAMACGLPTISSNVGGIPTIVTREIDGILVEPRNPTAIRDEIQRLLDHPELAHSLGQEAQKTAMERYSMNRVAAMHFDLFRSLHQQKIGGENVALAA
jgi:glycosyltransferase involved in cell wall biosynthesis